MSTRQDYSRRYMRRLRDEAKRAGRCLVCTKAPARPGRTECEPCAARKSPRRERWAATLEERRRLGLCPRCGVLPEPGYRQCFACRLRHARHVAARREQARQVER